MAAPIDTIWAITDATTDPLASDLNGGGFSTAQKGATGVDMTYGANEAVVAFTSTLSATGTTTLVDSGAGFLNTMLGNFVNIVGQGLYCIQGFTDTGHVTVDRALGTFSTTSGKVGGPVLTLGMAGQTAVGGNTFQVVGSIAMTSATNNVTLGGLTLLAGATTTPTQVIGSLATRGDGGRATITCGNAISTFKVIVIPNSGAAYISGLIINGASLTSSRGIDGSAGSSVNSIVYNCKVSNCTNSGIIGAVTLQVIACEVTGCATVAAVQNCSCFGCSIHDNTITGYTTSVTAVVVDTVSISNTGTSDGFGSTGTTTAMFVNCLAYGNGRDGFRMTASAANITLVNCYSEANVGNQYTATAAMGNIRLYYCYGKGTTVFNSTIASTQQVGCGTLTSTAFMSASTGDFRLNTTSDGGALLKAAGIPGQIASETGSISYPDIGPIQTQTGTTATLLGFKINP